MELNNFRIVENALIGFYIQEKEEKRGLKDNKPFESWSIFYHKMMPENNKGHIGIFNTKQEAIDFLEKLCTPDKFYYPDSFYGDTSTS